MLENNFLKNVTVIWIMYRIFENFIVFFLVKSCTYLWKTCKMLYQLFHAYWLTNYSILKYVATVWSRIFCEINQPFNWATFMTRYSWNKKCKIYTPNLIRNEYNITVVKFHVELRPSYAILHYVQLPQH